MSSFLLILGDDVDSKQCLEFQFWKSEFWQHFTKFSNKWFSGSLLQVLFFQVKCTPSLSPK